MSPIEVTVLKVLARRPFDHNRITQDGDGARHELEGRRPNVLKRIGALLGSGSQGALYFDPFVLRLLPYYLTPTSVPQPEHASGCCPGTVDTEYG